MKHSANQAVVMLPSQRTLRDYSHAVEAVVGFSREVDSPLMIASKVATCEEWGKVCGRPH